jgi:hypothetical protein
VLPVLLGLRCVALRLLLLLDCRGGPLLAPEVPPPEFFGALFFAARLCHIRQFPYLHSFSDWRWIRQDLTTFANFFDFFYFDGGSQLPQQILWKKFHIRCAYFSPNCTWSLNYSVLVFLDNNLFIFIGHLFIPGDRKA